jgi:large subunit ribosomal protein L24e
MKCSFCAKDVEPGTGMAIVQKTGKMLHFCSSKCRKNMLKLGRNPRKTKWVTKWKE